MILKKLKLLLIPILLFSFSSAKSQEKKVVITLKNPNSIFSNNKVIEIPWSIVTAKVKIDTLNMVVIDLKTAKQIPFQLEKKGGDKVVNLLVQITLAANQRKQIIISTGKRTQFPTKVYGRYVPERKDDFAWENNKIAYRMYGKALESTPQENAYGIDVWVKRTDEMILNKRYKLAEYHIDHGDGMDYYHVGYTLGAGNMMPFRKDSVYYSKNYVNYKVLDNGPLRVSFQLIYNGWNVGGKEISAVKTISLDAGSWLNKITVNYTAEIDVVAGIITRNEPGVKHLDEKTGILAYWEPTNKKDGTTGVACIFNSPVTKMVEKEGQLLAKTKTDASGNISYYQGATWDRQGTFTNSDQWIKYLQNFKKALQKPILVN